MSRPPDESRRRGSQRSSLAAPTVQACEPSRPTLLFYCGPSRDPDRLTRSLALAEALTAFFRVVILSGGELPPRLAVPACIESIELPSMEVDGCRTAGAAHELRVATVERRLLTELAMRVYRPAVLLVQAFPFSDAALASEILPLLRLAREQPGALTVVACSLLDPVPPGGPDQPRPDQARWLTDRFFDSVLVHADPLLVRLEDGFRPQQPLRTPVHYTGYVLPARAGSAGERRGRHLLVSAGDGRCGEALLSTALHARALLREPLPMRIVAGPRLPQAQWRALEREASRADGVQLVREAPDMLSEMRQARASISQCGHDIARDIVLSGVPALVVPHETANENEERERAKRLAAAGALRRVGATGLSAARLAEEIDRLLAFDPKAVALNLDGATHCAQRLHRLHAAAWLASKAWASGTPA